MDMIPILRRTIGLSKTGRAESNFSSIVVDYLSAHLSWGGWQNCTIEEEIFDLCSNGWGQGGYALIERGKNMCGIAQSAIIPNF